MIRRSTITTVLQEDTQDGELAEAPAATVNPLPETPSTAEATTPEARVPFPEAKRRADFDKLVESWAVRYLLGSRLISHSVKSGTQVDVQNEF